MGTHAQRLRVDKAIGDCLCNSRIRFLVKKAGTPAALRVAKFQASRWQFDWGGSEWKTIFFRTNSENVLNWSGTINTSPRSA
jgi:hypothetical protein